MKLLLPITTILFLCSCVSTPNDPSVKNQKKLTQENLVGIWAMKPLNNGIANVVNFTKNGQSILHSYTCSGETWKKGGKEKSTYKISNDGKNIYLTNRFSNRNLEIITLEGDKLETSSVIKTGRGDYRLNFSYQKKSKIEPSCIEPLTQKKALSKNEGMTEQEKKFLKDNIGYYSFLGLSIGLIQNQLPYQVNKNISLNSREFDSSTKKLVNSYIVNQPPKKTNIDAFSKNQRVFFKKNTCKNFLGEKVTKLFKPEEYELVKVSHLLFDKQGTKIVEFVFNHNDCK